MNNKNMKIKAMLEATIIDDTKYDTTYLCTDYLTERALVDLFHKYGIPYAYTEEVGAVYGMRDHTEYYERCIVYRTETLLFVYGNNHFRVEHCKV